MTSALRAFALVLTHICLCAFLGGCSSSMSKDASEFSELAVPDIGRNAAIVLSTDLHVQALIRDGKIDEASGVLDGSYLYQLKLMEKFERELATDERHIRLRNRVVQKLQREWLQKPPKFIDDQSAAYLERICSSLPDCPRGRVKGRQAIPELPQ